MPERSETRDNRLVTVICRSIDRPVLKDALDSIFSQSYAPIEVILVNSAGKPLESFSPSNSEVTVLDHKKPLSRSEAANAGIDAANGCFLLFLDDDDYISKDHVANLVSKIESDSSIRAVYSGTQKVTSQKKALNQVYSTEFDPLLLMRDNYIPIHSMLFERSLVHEGCRFDPQFEIYEDWDFWLQLAQKTRFVHVPSVTAFYRSGGDSRTTPAEESERFTSQSRIGKARAQIFEKWRIQWSGKQINGLIGSTMRINLAERYKNLESQYNKSKLENEIRQTRLNEEISVLESSINNLSEETLFLKSSLEESLHNNCILKAEIQERSKSFKKLGGAKECYKQKYWRDSQAHFNEGKYQIG